MISDLITNPIDTIIFFLLAMPGRLLAISAHEWGHAFVAYKCGDPTAKNMGRMTLNPLRHLDVMGFLMMLIAGFGWAKPVPVDPRNFRNYRKDDLKVSLAGITVNLILFLLGTVAMYAVVGFALWKASADIGYYDGVQVFVAGQYYLPMDELLFNAPYLSEFLIGYVFNDWVMYAYEMLMYFTLTNLVLAVFNLIPVPPLDGYHVLDDLVLHRFNVRLSPQTQQALYLALILLVIGGVTGNIIGFFQDAVFGGVGRLAEIVFGWMGLI